MTRSTGGIVAFEVHITNRSRKRQIARIVDSNLISNANVAACRGHFHRAGIIDFALHEASEAGTGNF